MRAQGQEHDLELNREEGQEWNEKGPQTLTCVKEVGGGAELCGGTKARMMALAICQDLVFGILLRAAGFVIA